MLRTVFAHARVPSLLEDSLFELLLAGGSDFDDFICSMAKVTARTCQSRAQTGLNGWKLSSEVAFTALSTTQQKNDLSLYLKPPAK